MIAGRGSDVCRPLHLFPQKIQFLMNALHSEDEEFRRSAALALGEIGPETTAVVLKFIQKDGSETFLNRILPENKSFLLHVDTILGHPVSCVDVVLANDLFQSGGFPSFQGIQDCLMALIYFLWCKNFQPVLMQ